TNSEATEVVSENRYVVECPAKKLDASCGDALLARLKQKNAYSPGGLYFECDRSTMSYDACAEAMLEVLRKECPRRYCLLAGYRAHAYRGLLQTHLPRVADWLHQNAVMDVSSLHQFATRYGRVAGAAPSSHPRSSLSGKAYSLDAESDLVLSRKLRMLSFLLLALTTEASQKAQDPPLPSIGKYKLNHSAADPLPAGMADVTMRIKMPEGNGKTRLADLGFRLGNGRRTGLTNLELRRPTNPEYWLTTSALSTYNYENCYSLRTRRGDFMDYQSVGTAFPELSSMHGATTHVCVDETSRRDDGTYARVTLSIGRVKAENGEEAVQFKIHLALRTDKYQSIGYSELAEDWDDNVESEASAVIDEATENGKLITNDAWNKKQWKETKKPINSARIEHLGNLPREEREKVGVAITTATSKLMIEHSHRCMECAMKKKLCVCDELRSMRPTDEERRSLNFDIAVYMHAKERYRASNTGKVLEKLYDAKMYSGRRGRAGYVDSVEEDMRALQEAIDARKSRCCVLFPSNDSKTVEELRFESVLSRPSDPAVEEQRVLIILVDGTWKQAKRLQ
ncbi:hypothetical protein FOZ63_028188, partial [Perkinsus olseni]